MNTCTITLDINTELFAFNSSAALHATGTTTASAGNNFTVTADNRLFVGNYDFTLEEQEADEAREMCEREDLAGLNRLFNALYLEQARLVKSGCA